MRWQPPVIYQEVAGSREKISGRYVLHGAQQVGFEVARYDASRPLVIDPVLSYSTYLSGFLVDFLPRSFCNGFSRACNGGGGIAIDADGNAYVTGTTISDFLTTPVPVPFTIGGIGFGAAFVAKVNPTGTALVYLTYLGGDPTEIPDSTGLGTQGFGIAIDADRNVYMTGGTFADNFPTTASAFQPTKPGGSTNDRNSRAFMAKLDATGSHLLYSTYLGGTVQSVACCETAFGIAVDRSGHAYVTGLTTSFDFPTTAEAFDRFAHGVLILGGTGVGEAFVTKLDPSQAGAASLVYSTYLGGSAAAGRAIAVDDVGNAYVAGVTLSADFPTTSNAFQPQAGFGGTTFITKLNPTGSAPLLYSTYLGGTSGEPNLFGIAVDNVGHVYVAGTTQSADFPTTPGAFQTAKATPGFNPSLFVAKLDSSQAGAASLIYATYLGGDNAEGVFGSGGIAVDTFGNAYITSDTGSSNFPTSHPLQSATGTIDAVIAVLNPSGSALLFSTYLGGASDISTTPSPGIDIGLGIAVDTHGAIYVSGAANSPLFPTTFGAYQGAKSLDNPHTFNAFVAKLDVSDLALGGVPPCTNVAGSLCYGLTQGAYGAANSLATCTGTTCNPVTGGLGYLPAANASGHNAFAGDPNATTIGVHVTRAITIAPSSSGGGTSATFSTDLATLIAYLPTSGTPGAFNATLVGLDTHYAAPSAIPDPSTGGSKGQGGGTLAGQAMTCSLNSFLSGLPGGFTSGGFAGLTLPGAGTLLCTKRAGLDKMLGTGDDVCEAFSYPSCVAGQAVSAVLAAANQQLALGSNALRCTASQLSTALNNINVEFDQGGSVVACPAGVVPGPYGPGTTQAGFGCP